MGKSYSNKSQFKIKDYRNKKFQKKKFQKNKVDMITDIEHVCDVKDQEF